jgi:L-aspartate oxidase
MGGIAVDEHARTSLPGLWAIGECASTGAHGANRLASNSLLEAIVFGARVAEDVAHVARHAAYTAKPVTNGTLPTAIAVKALRHTMTTHVGLERHAEGLTTALATITELERANIGDADMRNMTATALMIAGAALNRRESRGGHFRSDYPKTDAAEAKRTFVTLADIRETTAAAVTPTRAPAKLQAVR